MPYDYAKDTIAGEQWICHSSDGPRIPPIMHACHESRQEVSKVYEYVACGVWTYPGVDVVWLECVGPYDRDYW